MKEEDEELGSTSAYSDDDTQRIVLHVYDDESREFASLTTYHGMIRIYSSETWPSRVFWSLVVVTCLTLFMIHKRKDLLAIFDSVLLGDSFGSREIEKLKLLEEIYMNVTKSRLSMRKFLLENRSSCEELVKTLHIGDRRVSNHCKRARWSSTNSGYCSTFTWDQVSSTSHAFRMDVASGAD
ncbi:hypothetical protein ANCDUO_17342, partial [Ancylostoma duodenale]